MPVRILTGAWVLSTGMIAVAQIARSNAATHKPAVVVGSLCSVALAGAVQVFIGTDGLTTLVPLLGLWLIAGPAAVCLVLVAAMRRRQPGGPWLALFAGWLVVSALALPLILLNVTGGGAIRSC